MLLKYDFQYKIKIFGQVTKELQIFKSSKFNKQNDGSLDLKIEF